jgi:WD40 repeat protein
LIYHSGSDFIYDLVTGQKKELGELGIVIKGVDLAPDGQMLALEIIGARKQSMWSWLTELMENQADSTETYVSLNRFPSGKELTILRDCSGPVFSPDGKTLAVSGTDGSLHLWDLPIRKPIGKILGMAVLAAVATLLAFNGLGWLRRRRSRLEANLVLNSVPCTK